MAIRKIKDVTGTGVVFRGDEKLSGVDFHLEVHQKFIDASSHTASGEIPGMKQLSGAITGSDGHIPMGENLTLVADAGYSFTFILTGHGTFRVQALIDKNGNLMDQRGL